jgi:hypothetical protein
MSELEQGTWRVATALIDRGEHDRTLVHPTRGLRASTMEVLVLSAALVVATALRWVARDRRFA